MNTVYRKSIVFALVSLSIGAQAQLSINLSTSLAPNSPSYLAFQAAASLWTSRLTTATPVTVNLQVGYSSLGGNILGSTMSQEKTYGFSAYRTNLAASASLSATDVSAVASLGLPTATSYSFAINDTTDQNYAIHLATSSLVRMTNANAKAVGLYTGTDQYDASIFFNSDYGSMFDFDRSNGIGANDIDFVGIATHEIGHALGFDSGVDVLDEYAGGGSDADFDPYHYSLDLFRYSPTSPTTSVRAFLAGDGQYYYPAYFGFGGNVSSGPGFAAGANYGDGSQASHWRDDQNPNGQIARPNLGIMDPSFYQGQLGMISQNDLNAFDAIGYNLKAAPVPEPASLVALGLGALAVLRRRKLA